jgi:hypothetical protein
MAGPNGASELHDNSTDLRADIKEDGDAPKSAGNPVGVTVSGWDGTNLYVLKTDNQGRIILGAGAGSLVATVLQNVEETAELAGVDILPTPATAPADGVIFVEFITDTAAKLSLDLTRNAVNRIGDLNDGVAIAADQWQAFDFPVKSGDVINFQVDQDSTVTLMVSFQYKT